MGFVIEFLVTHVFSYRSSHAGERRAKRVNRWVGILTDKVPKISCMTRSVIRVRLLFHIDFFEISIILRIPKIPKEKKLSYIIFIIFHAKKY